MPTIDDLPGRGSTHDIDTQAELAFEGAIQRAGFFVVQGRDRRDYGTDFQLEARAGAAMTNLRVHVQVKGTTQDANADGSMSVQVPRTNLNYLLRQPFSMYVCVHLPTGRLLARFSEDVYRDYEHRNSGWQHQDEITVRSSTPFDDSLQHQVHATLLAESRADVHRRLRWATTPPDTASQVVQQDRPVVHVPMDPTMALRLLTSLYDDGYDQAISDAFDRFSAVLSAQPGAMDLAFMAEVNLGINHAAHNAERVRQAIGEFEAAQQRGAAHPASMWYCRGNAHLTLGEFAQARDCYVQSLAQSDDARLQDLAAQCSKNLGAALRGLDHYDAERACYQRAIELDPNLAEALLALALWHRRHDGDLPAALEYLDQIAVRPNSPNFASTVLGWRAEFLFRTGNPEAAFRDLNTLISIAARHAWVWPWCARLVAEHGRSSGSSARLAVRFWQKYLTANVNDARATRELFFTYYVQHAEGLECSLDFADFKAMAHALTSAGDPLEALIWDRVGHWAQDEGKWMEAEASYRMAHGIDPARYGYCLGTALNFLGRHEEALPILEPQATTHEPDALSWFQVAIAREGVGDMAGAIAAYETSLGMDPSYATAMFNLGGLHWNSRDVEAAKRVWSRALTLFPDHELADRLHEEIPGLFDHGPTAS